tara:strand:+ start:8363 stop:9688 length:1326 start_codon:yes stop_codon:yes gene_type:complete
MGWKKIITSLSNAVLNSLTTTGDVSASGNLYADLPSNTTNNGLVVVQDPDTGKLFKTGSYGGGGGGGSNVDFNVGGTTGTLTNLNITDFAGDVATSLDGGNLTITFGTPAQPSAGATSVTGFNPDRFNLQNDDYTINWSYNLNGTTFVEGQLQRSPTNTNSFTDIYEFSNGTTSVNVNSSTLSNLRIGSHKFRIRIKTTLANGESSGFKNGSSTTVLLSKNNPGGNATYNKSYSITPSAARPSGTSTIEEGTNGGNSLGTVTFVPVNNTPANGWTNLGWNSSATSVASGDTTPSNIVKTVSTTGGNNTGTRYQHFDSGDLNNPTLQYHDQGYGSYTRIRSFRYGASTKTSFSTSELQDLSAWPGTINYGTNMKTTGFTVNPGSSGKYIYIVYSSSQPNLSAIDTTTGTPQFGAFTKTTVGNYKVYRTNLLQYLSLSLIVST